MGAGAKTGVGGRTLASGLLLACLTAAGVGGQGRAPRLVLTASRDTPVITTRLPGGEGNRFGFEGGRVVKVNGVYHLFTSEMVDDPIWVRMRLGYWTSRDKTTGRGRHGPGVQRRVRRAGSACGALVTAPGVGRDRAALEPVLRGVPLRPGQRDGLQAEHDGRIWRAVSRTPGDAGIAGP